MVAETITVSTSDLDGPSSPPTIQYFGDYELLDEIARGGMGVVYRARQVTLNRTVAVKMILTGQLASREEVQRFFTEAEAAANLQHPNIVTIHEVGEHEGRQYFSMDYIDGPSLAELVRQHPLTPGKAAAYVKTIAEAIHYAHEQGTLHRDLKPSNILIDESDQPQITDFGLAAKIEGNSKLTASGAILGTPAYMPPEQARARRALIGPASDVYSLGAVLYELLTGRPPFQAATPLDTLTEVLEQDPVSPKRLNAGIPDDLATICLKCLEKRPEERYQTAGQLAEDLDRFLNQEPILARPASAVRKLWSWVKRRTWIRAAAVSLIVMASLGLACYLLIENSFLRWMQTHPDYIAEAGPITARVKFIDGLAVLWCLGGVWMSHLALERHCRICRLKGTTITTRFLTIFALLGTGNLASGMYYTVLLIQAHVWENYFRFEHLFWIFMTFSIGSNLLMQVIGEHRLKSVGYVPWNLPENLREIIRQYYLSDRTLKWQDETPALPRPEKTWKFELVEDAGEEKLSFWDQSGWDQSGWVKTNRAATAILALAGGYPEDAHMLAREIQMDLHRQFPEKVPAIMTLRDKLTTSLRFAARLLLFSVPVLCLFAVAGTMGQSPYLVAVAGFACAVGAILNDRGRHRRWRRPLLWGFLLQSTVVVTWHLTLTWYFALTGDLTFCYMLPMGVVTGCGYAFVIPYRLLAEPMLTPAADWRTDSIAAGSSSPASNNPHST